MNPSSFDYPFDPTGTHSTNLVQGERQLISPPNWRDYYIVIPNAAPYFRDSLKLVVQPGNRELHEGSDYYCTHRFHDATLATAKPVYGSILILDKTLTGALDMTYQTIGGEWTLNTTTINELLAQTLLDPRTTNWDEIVELPFQFPVIDHEWDVVDLTGMTDVVNAIDGIADVLREKFEQEDGDKITKESLGLGLVENHAMATDEQMLQGLIRNAYANPAGVNHVIFEKAVKPLLAHLEQRGNVHNMTKADIGLDRVGNHPQATVAEAIRGLSQELNISPFTLAEVLLEFYAASVRPHINARGNVHGLTKADIDLGRVANHAPATRAEGIQGTSDSLNMTPVVAKAAVMAWVGDSLLSHINARNPHGTDKSDVGLDRVPNLGLSSLEAARLGEDDSGLMTPRLTRELFNALLGGSGENGNGNVIIEHIEARGNPHGMTADDIDVYTREEVNTLLNAKLGLNDVVENAAKFSGFTLDEVIDLARPNFYWPATEVDEVNWTCVAVYQSIHPLISNTQQQGDLVFYVTGGDRPIDNNVPVYLVKLNVFSETYLKVEQVSGNYSNISFGYTVDLDNDRILIYARCAARRNPIGVCIISDQHNAVDYDDLVRTHEPTGITYAQVFEFKSFPVDSPYRVGDVQFGSTETNGRQNGNIVEFINVAETDDEINAARMMISNWSQEWRNYHRFGAMGALNEYSTDVDLQSWYWDGPNNRVGYRTAAQTRSTLLSVEPFDNYSFEVKFGSTDSGEGAIGVCAAATRVNGKNYGIYVLRTPGGFVVEGARGDYHGDPNQYKLLSVALNTLESDAVDLGSLNGNYIWGDGEGPERTEPYVPGGENAGWADRGACTIRITRVGDTIFVQSSLLGSDNVELGTSAQINLTSRPELAVFRRPTTWGLTVFNQKDTWFELINWPGRWQPYFTYTEDSYGQDTSTLSRHNGTEWISASADARVGGGYAGRLIYSHLNNKLYSTRRDGSLRFMGIQPYSPDGMTLLHYD